MKNIAEAIGTAIAMPNKIGFRSRITSWSVEAVDLVSRTELPQRNDYFHRYFFLFINKTQLERIRGRYEAGLLNRNGA